MAFLKRRRRRRATLELAARHPDLVHVVSWCMSRFVGAAPDCPMCGEGMRYLEGVRVTTSPAGETFRVRHETGKSLCLRCSCVQSGDIPFESYLKELIASSVMDS